ncbi:MAG: DUF2635 domain-containing protein [Thalassobaculaceae bacterium]
MSTMRVKPADGLKVRTEDGRRHIKVGGETVQASPYIRRRIAAGDLVRLPDAPARGRKPRAGTSTTNAED